VRYADAVELGFKRARRLDCLAGSSRNLRKRPYRSLDRRTGNRLHQRNTRPVVEDFDLPANAADVGIVLARDQCADARIRLGLSTRLPSPRFLRSIHRGDRIEPGKYAAEMAGIPGGK